MRASDLLLRGRGADVGVRAPGWLVRTCGAALAFATTWMLDALGVWKVVGLSGWVLHCVAMVGGALIAPTAFGAILWLLSGACAVTLMMVMYTPVVRPMIAPFVRNDADQSTPVDAVIVLSGGLSDDGRISGQALDRLLTGLQLVKQRHIPELALSVVSHPNRLPVVSSEADQMALVQLAVPELAPRFVRNVHSTRDEALAFAALARTHGWRRVLVVTSPMHSRRACMSVETAGLSVECRPAAGRDYSIAVMDHGENRRLVFQDVVYEWTATILYRVRDWM